MLDVENLYQETKGRRRGRGAAQSQEDADVIDAASAVDAVERPGTGGPRSQPTRSQAEQPRATQRRRERREPIEDAATEAVASQAKRTSGAGRPMRKVTPEELELIGSDLQPGQLLAFLWKLKESGAEETWYGSVRAYGTQVRVATEFGSFAFPPTRGDAELFQCIRDPAQNLPGLKMCKSMTAFLRTVPDTVIYCDGGTTMHRNVCKDSAAAVSVHDGTSEVPREQHAKFLIRSTVNVTEFMAVVAALRYTKAHVVGHTFIVMDSQLVYDSLTSRAQVKQPWLVDLRQEAFDLWQEMKDRVTLGHTFRYNNRVADALGKRARGQMKDIGDSSLFPTAPLVPEKPELPARRQVGLPYVADDFRDAEEQAMRIKTVEDFIAIRRLKVRSRCPDSVVPWLAEIAMSHLVRAAAAHHCGAVAASEGVPAASYNFPPRECAALTGRDVFEDGQGV